MKASVEKNILTILADSFMKGGLLRTLDLSGIKREQNGLSCMETVYLSSYSMIL